MSQTKAELINAKGDAAFDTNTLFINSTNNRVGIGTTNPTNTALHVEGSGLAGGIKSQDPTANDWIRIAGDDAGNLINWNTGQSLRFATSSDSYGGFTERARIDSSGRLLVGTSSALAPGGITPQIQLEGTSAGDSSVVVKRNSNDAGRPIIYFAKSRGTTKGSNTIVQSNDILGSLLFAGADGSDIVSLGAEISAQVDGTPGANDMPGRLVFSTTNTGDSSPSERLRIDDQGQAFLVTEDDCLEVATVQGSGTSKYLLRGRYNATVGTPLTGTVSFEVTSNGDVTNTNNSYNAISDLKLKENIIDANPQWDDIKALQVRNYNFKPETNHQTHTQIGLIAQEVELVSPGLVSESPDLDEDGNDLGTVTKSVNYSVLYMKAVKALQEAMERIETLEQRLNDAGIN